VGSFSLLILAQGGLTLFYKKQAILWPEAEIEAARNNLRQTLHLACQVLKNAGHSDSGIFVDHNGWLGLTSEGETWVDAEAFERAAAACHQLDDTSACKNALVLYTGELLPEDRYEDWVTLRRESLRWLSLSLQTKLGIMLEAQEDIEQAIDIFHQVISVDPTAEHAHRALMRLYTCAGLRHQAMQQYQRLREILDRELAHRCPHQSLPLFPHPTELANLPNAHIRTADDVRRFDVRETSRLYITRGLNTGTN
jgi:DNA-binding SARP family transcriptional activator